MRTPHNNTVFINYWKLSPTFITTIRSCIKIQFYMKKSYDDKINNVIKDANLTHLNVINYMKILFVKAMI
jgi:hypothetical protein